MNAKTLKTKIRNAGFNLAEWKIEKSYKSYNIILTSYGLSDNERQQMTGDEVNAKKNTDKNKIEKMAELLNVQPQRISVTINIKLLPYG